MATKTEKVSIAELEPGMYVSQLDRPWIETPFPIQGFHIREQADIDTLRRFCKYVFIDRELSKSPRAAVSHAVASKRVVKSRSGQQMSLIVPRKTHFKPVRYENQHSLKKEVAIATLYHKEIQRATAHIYSELRKGHELNYRVAKKAVSVLVNSVIRNPDAFVWLSRIKQVSTYAFSHSLRCAMWAVVFGRHLGLPKEQLDHLALGCLLADVGKTRLSRTLLNKVEPLTESEQQEARDHVHHGVEIVQGIRGIPDEVVSIVQLHHERHDGSGYPFGLSGADIPLLARIAGIVDTYDAVTSERPFAEALTSTDAVALLYQERDKAFQASLVEQFIQAVGIYPTGTLVELNSGEIGIVIEQNRERRLRPKLMLVTDSQHKRLDRNRLLDLLALEKQGKEEVIIKRTVESGTAGIRLEDLQVSGL